MCFQYFEAVLAVNPDERSLADVRAIIDIPWIKQPVFPLQSAQAETEDSGARIPGSSLAGVASADLSSMVSCAVLRQNPDNPSFETVQEMSPLLPRECRLPAITTSL
jgi:hypothetical protein